MVRLEMFMKKIFAKNGASNSVTAVYSITIDFNYKYQECFRRWDEDIHLSPGGTYHFDNKNEIKNENKS